ncbi:MAG: hypothetical protein HQ528_04895 [Candidatus Marinimicrobia bacterium]|nr:hypothetical protein [Candidatus Neomarinimicrobiota bacterium]
MSFKLLFSLLSIVLFLNINIGSGDNDNVIKGGDEDTIQKIEIVADSGTGEND